MLNRLLKLYSKSNSITPVEDFTTEAFASLLECDEIILNTFLTEILNAQINYCTIETQKHYTLNSDSHSIIDLVISNQDTICFVENKVESAEGKNQLEKYADILDNLIEYKNKYLFYCTKYYDPKEEVRHRFKQFRWHQIAKVIEKSENQLAIEFHNFLKTNNMAQNDYFSVKDLYSLENLKGTLDFLDSFLERISPSFTQKFGKHSKPDNCSQMRKYNRYIFFKADVFGSDKYNEIGVGFNFDKEPKAYIWIWTSANNTKASRFNEYLKEFSSMFDLCEKDCCSFSEDLIKFIGKENSMFELENWFNEKFNTLKDFISKTPDLNWNIN